MINQLKSIVKGNKFLYRSALVIAGKKNLIGRSLKKTIKGSNNQIAIEATTLFSNSEIKISGNNNKISVAGDCSFNNVLIYILGDGNTIIISEEVRFNSGGSLWIDDNNCSITIGSKTTFENTSLALTDPHTRIIIGKDCMFAYDVDLRTGDSHSILHGDTNDRINYGKDILIGDRVWIASHVSILKGVTIANNSIVATRSLVTKSFEQKGDIIGGNPAKTIKSNVTWKRERILKK
ncbi:MAG: acetyltransferase (isoleucine patch superfamily)-like protein [Mucilaginibacter sp.]|nr:acetyltransferase (isoleucine patch superfamily)-like protein [Mucilaginibacter sp.]